MMRRASRLNVLENFELASPCDMAWDAMIGNDQKRFCGACNKNVYNLVDMEVEDIADLIIATEGKFCGRVYQRADGTLLTQDCPVGLAKVVQEAKRRSKRMILAAVTFACAGASYALFGNTTDPRVFGQDAAGAKVIEKVQAVMSIPETPEPLQPVPGGLRPMRGEIAPIPTNQERAPEPVKGNIRRNPVKMGKMAPAPRD